MTTTNQIWSAVSKYLKWKEVESSSSSDRVDTSSINVNDEYLKACRTQSYVEFSRKAQQQSAGIRKEIGTASPNVLSFELLASNLLDPDEDKVLCSLIASKDIIRKPELFSLVSEYFAHSLKASNLYTFLLKSIEKSRERCDGIKLILEHLSEGQQQQQQQQSSVEQLWRLANEENPFLMKSSGSDVMRRFEAFENEYLSMQKKLDKLRKVTGKRLRTKRRCLKASKVITRIACVVVMVITGTALMLAAASILMGCKQELITVAMEYIVRWANKRKTKEMEMLEKQWKQLEAVAQGTFVLVQDVDTMKRLVMRLGNEVEFTNSTIAFCKRHNQHSHHPHYQQQQEQEQQSEEVVVVREGMQQLRKNQSVLLQLLDDLEENIYLCFMSINKARSVVIRHICS